MTTLVLLIFIFMKSGQIEVHTSVTNGTKEFCNEVIPLYIKLYKKHGFEDGPDPKGIKKITGRCEKIENEKNLEIN